MLGTGPSPPFKEARLNSQHLCKVQTELLDVYLPLHWVLGEKSGILFVGFIRDMASAALLSLKTKVEHRAMGHTAMRRDTGNSLLCTLNSGKFPSEGLNMFITTVHWGHLSQTDMEACGNPEPSWVKEAAARML